MKKTAQELDNRQKKIDNSFSTLLANIYYLLTSSARGAGFTLIEVLVATTILATLVGGVMLSLNPIGQINKGRDAQRQQDLQSIKTALDLYYNDTKCYPTQLPFGQEWRVNNTVYMKSVPNDPQCNEDSSGTCYRYRTDSASNCPQWNVVFADLSRESTLANACPLSSLSTCTPTGYANGQFACVLSGGVDCDLLASTSIIGGALESMSPTPTPNPCEAPTNRNLECACAANNQCNSQYCDLTVTGHTGTDLCKPLETAYDPNDVSYPLPQATNPNPYEIIFNPLYPIPGSTQTIKVKVQNPGVNIDEVQVAITSDNGTQRIVPLNPPTGQTNNAGTWSALSPVGGQETFYNQYAAEIGLIADKDLPTQIVGYETIGIRGTGL